MILCSQVKAVVTELGELITRIKADHKIQKIVEEPLSMNIFTIGGTSTTGANGQFIFSQILIDCLLRLKTNKVDKKELIDHCKQQYQGNSAELSNLREFREDYSPEKALWWYTRESFFYKTLNAALCNENIHIIFLFRGFISDIHRQLEAYQADDTLRVYRSQMISSDELETLKKSCDQFISINSFFSTSTDKKQALSFLNSCDVGDNLEPILFEIDANPALVTSKPFADVSPYSEFTDESEVLFMLGSIFRLQNVNRSSDDRVWIVRMTLCSDDEHDLKQIFIDMKDRLLSSEINLQTLGKLLWEMGKPDLTEKYFMRMLEQLSSDDPLLGDFYHDLGRLASNAGNLDKINIPVNAKWAQNGVTIAGGNGLGSATNQLNHPFGLFVDDDQTVVIADWGNNRIMQWKNGDTTNGQVVAGGKGRGDGLHQLDRPTDVLIDKETNSLIICDLGNQRVVRWSRRSGTTQGEILIDDIRCDGLAMDEQRYLYVSAVGKDEVRRYRLGEKNGTLVAGGNGAGGGLNQLKVPGYLFVDRDHSVYVSDYSNHRVMKWVEGAKEGIVVAGGQNKGNALTQLCYPLGIFVDTLGTLFVIGSGDCCVMRWTQGDKKQGTVVVGGNYRGARANQFNRPCGLSFDRHGNLYVADGDNNRVQRFSIE
ncbi:unnamed protein product [Rotaria socialis]|uniref:Uncharacterized protein n=1 Tax=Rotaria socialis TaxID=392032 RepID=A0A821P485_9BILA|nr:unnamed protein product [Rotaria socialis]